MPSNQLSGGWSVKTLVDDPTHPLHPQAITVATPITPLVAGALGTRAAVTTDAPAPAPAPVASPRQRTHLAACPACGRLVALDMLLDVRPFDVALRTACGWTAHDFVCDGCQETAKRTGALSLAAIVTAHGAPSDIVARCQAHDVEVAKYRLARSGPAG